MRWSRTRPIAQLKRALHHEIYLTSLFPTQWGKVWGGQFTSRNEFLYCVCICPGSTDIIKTGNLPEYRRTHPLLETKMTQGTCKAICEHDRDLNVDFPGWPCGASCSTGPHCGMLAPVYYIATLLCAWQTPAGLPQSLQHPDPTGDGDNHMGSSELVAHEMQAAYRI